MSFPASHPEGSPHRFFARLVGAWAGTTRTWQDADAEPGESKTQGSVQLILDGRFIVYLYQSSIDGEPQHGMFTFGYDTTLDQYEASWVDSFHNNTAIMYCIGAARANGFSVLGSYPDPDGGPDWGWRTDVELLDPDHLSISAFNISPEGGEALVVKTLLNRVKR